MSAQTFRCCPHCADDQPHIEKDTHELPCTLCYGDVERHTAAIAEAAREYVAIQRSGDTPQAFVAYAILAAEVDAEQDARAIKSKEFSS